MEERSEEVVVVVMVELIVELACNRLKVKSQ
jgi:hypothetical protein